MPGDLLGQESLIEQILPVVADTAVRIVRVTGASGTGKTTVSLAVGAAWTESGGRCVFAIGDEALSSRDLHPFLNGLAGLPGNWRDAATAGSRTVLRAADALVPVAASSIFDLLRITITQRLDRPIRYLTATEREIVLDIRRLARRRRLLLVADNAHWWDEASLALLLELVSDRLRDALPPLGAVTVLVVDSAGDQGVSAPTAFDRVVAAATDTTWRLSRCTKSSFGEILRLFGLEEPLPADIQASLYEATAGHLKLVEQIVAYARENRLGSLVGASRDGYLSALLNDRIAQLGPHRGQLLELLGRAATMGLSLRTQDLACLGQDLEEAVEDLIERAEDARLLQRVHDRVAFSHDIVRRVVIAHQSAAQTRVNLRRLERCLALLRPGDYEARADALLSAGEADRGRELLALGAIAAIRRGDVPDRVLTKVFQRLPDDASLHEYLDTMARGYTAVQEGRFSEVIAELLVPDPDESAAMAAERRYLAALCCLELETDEGLRTAVDLLNSWAARDGERELGLRFQLLLQQAYVLGQRFDDARRTELEIERSLLTRTRFDPEAAVLLQVQNRRSGATAAPEIAELRIREAVEYFRADDRRPFRHRVELYRSQNNLTAILIRLGRYPEAYTTGLAAEKLVLDAPDGLPRLDVLAGNVLLAGVRAGVIEISDAVTQQQTIVDTPTGADEKFLHRCNLAAYLLLAGRDGDGLALLSDLQMEMVRRSLTESYLLYYLSALEVAAFALNGNEERASQLHLKLTSFVDDLRWPSASYVRRRHYLLVPFLKALPLDRTQADTALLRSHPYEIGPAWDYYARLIPLCELSFWLDS